MTEHISVFKLMDNTYDEIIKKNKLDISDICEFGLYTDFDSYSFRLFMSIKNFRITIKTYYIKLYSGLVYKKEVSVVEEDTQDE